MGVPRVIALALLPAALSAAPVSADEAPARPGASSAFCLFELPREGDTQRLVNLGIVQYVDVAKEELRLYFGGGNLGSGHELRLAVKGRAEALEWVTRMQAAARDCAQGLGQRPAATP